MAQTLLQNAHARRRHSIDRVNAGQEQREALVRVQGDILVLENAARMLGRTPSPQTAPTGSPERSPRSLGGLHVAQLGSMQVGPSQWGRKEPQPEPQLPRPNWAPAKRLTLEDLKEPAPPPRKRRKQEHPRRLGPTIPGPKPGPQRTHSTSSPPPPPPPLRIGPPSALQLPGLVTRQPERRMQDRFGTVHPPLESWPPSPSQVLGQGLPHQPGPAAPPVADAAHALQGLVLPPPPPSPPPSPARSGDLLFGHQARPFGPPAPAMATAAATAPKKA